MGNPLAFKVGVGPKSQLKAVVIRACIFCNAPGVYKANLSVKENWPGVYSPERAEQPVGYCCPNCGALRPKDEDKGVIWERQNQVSLWLLAGEAIANAWRRLRGKEKFS